MKEEYKLSLTTVILINLNIMLGVGLFINTTELAKRAGVLGAFSYATIGFLLFPLIFSFVQLLQRYPTGGFYTFGTAVIHPFVGFLSTWSYFIGKLASTMLIIHTFVLLIQEAIPFISSLNPLMLDCIAVAGITILNLFNIKTGSAIQAWTMAFKLIPIMLIIGVGLFLVNGANFIITKPVLPSIISTLPLVLFATIGFEAACSLSNNIQDPQKNAPRAVLFSYAIIILLYCLYQLIFYGILGTTLSQQLDYRGAFPAFLSFLLPHAVQLRAGLLVIINIAIAVSALGAAYGIFYSNMWNLYILAQHGHIIASNKLTLLNKQQVPFLCVIAQACICLLYLAASYGSQLPLQRVGTFGISITYTISVLSLLLIRYRNQESLWLPLFGFINCLILFIACINGLFETGIIALNVFVALFCLGIVMFWYTSRTKLA
ncbi:MAG: APC family permease [Candidatus Babeliales bacterium]|jgi:amino acid transporter